MLERSIHVNEKSQLDMQIEIAEANFERLSEYEKMRLKNMRERRDLLKILDVDEEKGELNALTPKKKKKTRKVNETIPLRKKSARIQSQFNNRRLSIGPGSGKIKQIKQ